jgi:hypothetical protein
MALKCLCHGTKYPIKTPLFGLLIKGVPWHKKGFSDLVQGTHIKGLGYSNLKITRFYIFTRSFSKNKPAKSC